MILDGPWKFGKSFKWAFLRNVMSYALKIEELYNSLKLKFLIEKYL